MAFTCSSCAQRGGESGGVHTPPAPQIPRAQVFLNFILVNWSGTDVEIDLSAAIAATAPGCSRPLHRACFRVQLLGRFLGRIRPILGPRSSCWVRLLRAADFATGSSVLVTLHLHLRGPIFDRLYFMHVACQGPPGLRAGPGVRLKLTD